MQDDLDLRFGRRLRRRRRMLGMTQEQVAKSCGLRFQQIQKYECASNRMSAARIWQLATVLGVPIAYFFEGRPGDAATGTAGHPMSTEAREFVRAFEQLAEGPRRQLLALAIAMVLAPEVQTSTP